MKRKSILFSDLFSTVAAVRITCAQNGCGGIIEIPLEKLKAVGGETPVRCPCPNCDGKFIGVEKTDLPKFKAALENLAATKYELVLKKRTKKKPASLPAAVAKQSA